LKWMYNLKQYIKQNSCNKYHILLTHFQRLLTPPHQTHLSQRPARNKKKNIIYIRKVFSYSLYFQSWLFCVLTLCYTNISLPEFDTIYLYAIIYHYHSRFEHDLQLW
jgi:hypothetical protein